MRLVVCVVVGSALLVSAASASFPGRNGLIAVQPVTGAGLILVNAGGGNSRRVCTDRAVCGSPRAPSWSSDGRVIAVGSINSEVKLIYPDGSCLNCHMEGALRPAFTPNPSSVSVFRLVERCLRMGSMGFVWRGSCPARGCRARRGLPGALSPSFGLAGCWSAGRLGCAQSVLETRHRGHRMVLRS